jgi:DNA-binding IscR family transcriptional regulator
VPHKRLEIQLTRAGLVTSHRCHTGWRVFAPHRAATAFEIVEAAKGPIRVNICLGSDEECNRSPSVRRSPLAGSSRRARERAAQRRQTQAIEEAAMQAAEPTIIRRGYGGFESLLYV